MIAILVTIAIAGSYYFPQVQKQLGAVPGTTHTEAEEFIGGFSLGLVNSTTTSVASYTLIANDLANARQGALYDTILFTKTVGASGGGNLSTTTLTFPASSTMSHILPRTGMRHEQCWVSATSTSAQLGFILAAGTGFDFMTSSTTPTDLTVNGGAVACLKFIRQSDSDFSVLITDYQTAD